MLVSEMLQEMRDAGFDDLTDTRMLGFLNDTYYDVCSRSPWPFLEAAATPTVSAVTGLISTPTDVKAVLKFVDTTRGTKLEPVRYDEFLQRNADQLTLAGNPTQYTFIGSSLYVFPIPTTATLKLFYLKNPAALTTSPDATPILPTAHHEALVLGALVKCYMLEDDAENAQDSKVLYEARLETMRDELWMRQYDRPDTIWNVDEYDWVDWLTDGQW